MLSGAQCVWDIINGHPQACYELFQMDKQTFLNLCDHLKRHENLPYTWLVIVEETVYMFLLIINEYEETFLYKTPQRTSIFSGAQFVRDMIDGHPQTCYELFQMDKQTFLNLCDHLKWMKTCKIHD